MNSNNWRAAQGQVRMPGQAIGGVAVPAVGMDGDDWRNQLPQGTRVTILNMIMGTLKKHLPFSGQEGLQEHIKTALTFEENVYTAATSPSDYLIKIGLRMLAMEKKSQNPMANSLQSNATSTSQNPQNPAQGQVRMPGQVNGGVGMHGGDWRNQLLPCARQRVVNKIMETLKRHLPFSGQEGLQEHMKIAVTFEAKVYNAATSPLNYLRNIALGMSALKTNSQNPVANSLQTNTTGTSQNHQNPASQTMQYQMQNHQVQDSFSSTGVPNSAGLSENIDELLDEICLSMEKCIV